MPNNKINTKPFCEKHVKYCNIVTKIKQFFINIGIFIMNNLKVILPLAIVIGLIIFIIVMISTSKKSKNSQIEKAVYVDRIQKCLVPYNQKALPVKDMQYDEYIYNNPYYKEDMSYCLRDYFWAGSYKSYMPCGTQHDVVSYETLKKNVLAGARVIWLDIFYNGPFAFSYNTEIVVANFEEKDKLVYEKVPEEEGDKTKGDKKLSEVEMDSKPKKKTKNIKVSQMDYLEGTDEMLKKHKIRKYLDFKKCLEIIRDFGFKTNQPLVLYLNIGFEENIYLESKIYNLIFEVLGERLMEKNFSFGNINFGAIRMDKAINKALIVLNRKSINGNLNEITNGYMNLDKNFGSIILYNTNEKDRVYGGIKVKFFNKENALSTTKFIMNAVYFEQEKIDSNQAMYDKTLTNKNLDPTSAFDFGVQIIFMNFQTRDDNFNKFKERFTNGIIRKPEDIIFIPQPPPPVYERDKKYDFNNMQASLYGGFQEFQV